ncbi:fructoselysine transporter [Escherichia coli]|uniref:Fructoselysine transporter n=1 Tax=Escherichia coli TaxID=562 RepID=A0A2X1MUW4_ECOLX|nr:fructoselysine transporter [Escherichia coli]
MCVYAELSTAYPENGADYVYLKNAGSRPLAFLSGWASFWANDAPSLSIMALAIVSNLGFLTPIDPLLGKFYRRRINYRLYVATPAAPLKAAQRFRR